MSGEPLDKDELIRDLRRQLAAAQSELRLTKRRTETRGALIDRLREAPRKEATAPAEVTSQLGRSRGLWHSPVLLGVVVLVMLAFAVDAGVGRYQAHLAKQQRQARLQLENTAMRSLYVELRRIVALADGKSFRLTLSLQNTSPAGPLYVMLNPVAVYVQSGMVWQQVPSKPADAVGAGVVAVSKDYSYDVLFTPDVANWAELMPGYMHVRIQDDLLVSQRAQPGDDVVERRTPFYVYLRPPGSAAPPPLFIPMPPH
jgi:hypothetical protein